jgi:hypothetical protein
LFDLLSRVSLIRGLQCQQAWDTGTVMAFRMRRAGELQTDRTTKPSRMKATGNPIANSDPRHSFADRCDLAGAVGQRHCAESSLDRDHRL